MKLVCRGDDIEEFLKCDKNPLFFIEKYVNKNINQNTKSEIRELFQFTNIRTLNNDSIVAYLVYNMTFNTNESYILTSIKLIDSKYILQEVAKLLLELPDLFKPNLKLHNINRLETTMNNSLSTMPAKVNSFRGISATCFIFNNFMQLPDELFKSIYPSIHHARCIKLN